jgi:DNA modification methylase
MTVEFVPGGPMTQLSLGLDGFGAVQTDVQGGRFNDPAFASNKTQPIHRWVPWIAGFSKDFVADGIARYISAKRGVVLDPFAGVGTTLVEGMLGGHDVIGFEINPYPYLATCTKLHAVDVALPVLRNAIERFGDFYADAMRNARTPQATIPEGFQSRIPFYSPLVLRKVLTVLDFISQVEDGTLADVFRIAFAATMVSYSNYSYEPSLGTRVSSGKANIEDALVGETIQQKLLLMLADIEWVQLGHPGGIQSRRKMIHDSFFKATDYLADESVDLIITSPPYLNNYHYNRNTRPHLYWLGFARSPRDLKPLEEANFGRYWQLAREMERVDLTFTLADSELAEKLEKLRQTHLEKGIYGGPGWANYAALYFNDCRRFAQQAHAVLKPGGRALVVIGNSILQGIMMPTDRYLAAIAALEGFEITGLDIPRATRVGSSIIQSEVRAAKAGHKDQLYEAVVTLRKL